jgi:ribose 5-phosphate isomerase A
MKTTGGSDEQKRAAGENAAQAVEDGMVVGLGTGSTAAHAIRALGRRVDSGLDVQGIPTSFQSRELAKEVAIPLTSLDQVERVHLAIDGADQFSGPHLIKGGGAAHAQEKIVDAAADRLLVVADPSKFAKQLDHSVPVEVLPDARTTAADEVQALGATPTLRTAESKDGPVVTDNGNLVLDCEFVDISNPAELAAELAEIPGAVEHGLFVGMADEIHIGHEDGVEVKEF